MSVKLPLVSILLPSVRPETVRQRVLDFANTEGDLDYEIVVVSEFEIIGDKVVHVPETVRLGANGAQAEAYLHSRGEFIVWMSDDAIPTDRCITNIVSFVRSRPSPFVASFRVRDATAHMRQRGQYVIYGKPYACWGCASRLTIELLGGFFDPVYRALFGDPDFSMRCWKAGGKVVACPNATIVHNDVQDDLKGAYQEKWAEIDGKIFHDRWDPMFGSGTANHPNTMGGFVPPLSIWQAPFLWIQWYWPLLPSITMAGLFRLRETLYPLVVRVPGYSIYRRAKSKEPPPTR